MTPIGFMVPFTSKPQRINTPLRERSSQPMQRCNAVPATVKQQRSGKIAFQNLTSVSCSQSWVADLSDRVRPPESGRYRLATVLRVWAVGTVMIVALFNFLFAVADYSLAIPGPNRTAGFLLGGFVLSMFISAGVWGAFAAILPPKVAFGGVLTTGALPRRRDPRVSGFSVGV
jgi:hypothetical protein